MKYEDNKEDDLEIEEIIGEEEDCKKEREFVNKIQNFQEFPLICKDVRKIYNISSKLNSKVAVNNFSLSVGKNEIFGLLGPNGAGKTTLISMITGLYQADKGY